MGPKETDIGLVRVKALGNAGVILEQFEIEVEATSPPLPPAHLEASYSSFSAEETTLTWHQAGRRPQGIFIPMTSQ